MRNKKWGVVILSIILIGVMMYTGYSHTVTTSSSISEFSVSNITISGDNVEVRTLASSSSQNYEMIFTEVNNDGFDFSVSKTGYIYTDSNGYDYIFFPDKNNLWGLKLDKFGDVIWSFKYSLSDLGIIDGIYRLIGEQKGNSIYLLFENKNGYDYFVEVDMNSGVVKNAKESRIPINDVFSFDKNSEKYYLSYGRSFGFMFTKYQMYTGDYEYIFPGSLSSRYITLTVQNDVTNGGYDYILYEINTNSHSVIHSYTFGSNNNDYLYGIDDNFEKVFSGRKLLPGYVIDDDYVYVILDSRYTPLSSQYIGFSLLKVNRDDGSIVWFKDYRFKNYQKNNFRFELLKIESDNDYIYVTGKITHIVNSNVYGQLIILKLKKSDGTYDSNLNNIRTHGAIMITDTKSSLTNVLSYSYDNSGYIHVLSMVYQGNKYNVRYVKAIPTELSKYKINIKLLSSNDIDIVTLS